MGDWGGLMVDILFLIAERIKVVEDFVSFSSVCATWRAAALRKGSARSLQPLRLLMFESWHRDLSTHGIYSFARDKVYTVSLPAHTLHFYTNGWILTESDKAEISLIHPFSPHVISLTPETAFLECPYVCLIKKAVLSCNPSFFPDDYTLMVIYGNWQYPFRLGFWKPRDREWTMLRTDKDTFFKDIIYYRGQFYAIDQRGVIYACDLRGSNPTVVVVSEDRIPFTFGNYFLVGKTDIHSSLLIVARGCRRSDGNPSYFKVYELDLIGKRRVKELYDLGDRTIFVSNYHGSVCVEHSKFPPGIIEDDHIAFHNFHCSESWSRNSCQATECLHKREMRMRIYSLKGGDGDDFFYPLQS